MKLIFLHWDSFSFLWKMDVVCGLPFLKNKKTKKPLTLYIYLPECIAVRKGYTTLAIVV